jgi:hypothetical protein
MGKARGPSGGRRRTSARAAAHSKLEATAHLYARLESIHTDDGATLCAYCGVLASTLDYIPPIDEAYRALVHDDTVTGEIVDACPECVRLGTKLGILGIAFDDFATKRALLVARFEKRNLRVSRLPAWSAEELTELAPTLRQSVVAGEARREQTVERLRFMESLAVESREELEREDAGREQLDERAARVTVLPDEPIIDEMGRRVWPDENGEYTLVEREVTTRSRRSASSSTSKRRR